MQAGKAVKKFLLTSFKSVGPKHLKFLYHSRSKALLCRQWLSIYWALTFQKRGGEYKIGLNFIQSLSLRSVQGTWDPACPHLYMWQLTGPLGGTVPFSPSWVMTVLLTGNLVTCGLMTKDLLEHLFSTPPCSLSGFLFFAIKQKEKDMSILGGNEYKAIYDECPLNEWMLNEMKDGFCQRTFEEWRIAKDSSDEVNFLEELRAESTFKYGL